MAIGERGQDFYQNLSSPHAIEAEQSVLGAVIIEPSCIQDLIQTLTPACFFKPLNGAIFGVMGGILWIILRCRGRVEGLTLRQMLILLAFSLYFGFTSPDVANAAHLAGLAIGFLMAVPLYRHHKREADYV